MFPIAARNPRLAAVIAQTPLVDAPGAMPRVLPCSTPRAQLRLAARSVLRLGFYRPGRYASRIGCPLLVVVCDDDHSTPPARPSGRVAR